MPDKADVPAYDQCTSCAFASQKGEVNGPLPTLHTDVCCLYKFQRHGQSEPLCQKEEVTCDGRFAHCPKFRQLQDLSSDGGEPATVPETPKNNKGSRIVPRQRRGFKKLTIELRPPKFRKKLWFGTYEPEDVDRAKDAINFYMGIGERYILPDSPLLFAQYKLGIEYRDLVHSCEQFIEIGEKRMRASAYFARSVKDVIKTITGKEKKKRQQPRGKKGAQKEATPEFVMSCTSGVTSSVDMVWDTSSVAAACGASSEANSELVTNVPSEMLTCQAEIPEEVASSVFNWDMFFQEIPQEFDTFVSSESSPPVDEGLEDNGFSFPSFWL